MTDSPLTAAERFGDAATPELISRRSFDGDGSNFYDSTTPLHDLSATKTRATTPLRLTCRSTPGFMMAQTLGAAAATALFRWLVPALPRTADHVVVPRAHQARS